MNGNPVRSALDLVDAEPSTEFLSALRAQLLADDRTPIAATPLRNNSASTVVEEYVELEPRLAGTTSTRRLYRVVLAVAACVALVAAILVIKRTSDSDQTGLRDVDPREALPLGAAAGITADQITRVEGSAGWQQVDDFSISDYAKQTAAINAQVPACALLADVGLAQPTSKSVIVHQDFANGPVPMFHDVWVFATPGDASRAMDAIAGDVFPTCWLKLFDRLTALNRNITAKSTSTRWLRDPTIVAHGDRQVIFGQKIHYTFLVGSTDAGAINAFVQVGRAIAFIDPQHLGDVGPDSNVEEAIAASTDALKKVFGK